MNTPQIVAEMWYCGDEVCECSQPEINRLTPNRYYPQCVDRETIEKGPFYSGAAMVEIEEQCKWLLEAARRHNVANLEEIEAAYSWLEESLTPTPE